MKRPALIQGAVVVAMLCGVYTVFLAKNDAEISSRQIAANPEDSVEGRAGRTDASATPTQARGSEANEARQPDDARSDGSWPLDARGMETHLLRQFARLGTNRAASAPTAVCSSTRCTLKYLASRSSNKDIKSLANLLADAPYNASLQSIGTRAVADEIEEVELLFAGKSVPSPEDQRVKRSFDARILRSRAQSALPLDAQPASPIAFGKRADGAEEVVENLCVSSGCSYEPRRMIYLRLPEGRSCVDFDGTETYVPALDPESGAYRTRAFCVPNALIEGEGV